MTHQLGMFDEPLPPHCRSLREPQPEPAEAERRSATRERVLARLQEGPATNVQLLDICMRFGARILELRREGYDIRTKPRGGGIFLYVLHAAPAAGREP